MATTGYTRRQLYGLFASFKALCAVSGRSGGIDRDTWRRGNLTMAMEDTRFATRVFDLLVSEAGAGGTGQCAR